ncbi:site-specific integrase [Flavicella sp.]|uniref:site-specific integrase n=1 Tax=Flavicella sp. TaxID=2957742 RepID=UPI0026218E96|nr:site-specific integrase [Flavicella sp.]MDG1805911.1 site-specific integrase [Flavicella sp.]
MLQSITTLFYIKRSKIDAEGKSMIYLRVTINQKRAEVSTKLKVHIDKWCTSTSKGLGRSSEIRILNNKLEKINTNILDLYERLRLKNSKVSSRELVDVFQGKVEHEKMLIKIFDDHNKMVEKLVGKDFAPGTLERYKTARMHVFNYLNHEYKLDDIPVVKVDLKFINGLEYYLKTERDCGHNTTVKYITNFKKIIRIAKANEWIEKDPFYNWKSRLKIVDREFLSQLELQKLIDKEFENERLERVKDFFLFSCFTGLAYVDVKKLKHNDIVIGIDGEKWIDISRKKTATKSRVPLLTIPKIIIDKYKDHPLVVNNDMVLPMLSNQKMNSYLKEISDVAGINKNLTYHLARHTFATTVTLSNGVPMESVSKMLGHKSIKTTQHYAKVLDVKVSNDMQLLKSKIEGDTTNFSDIG